MSLLTVTELREHFETDLKDEAIQRLIDDAEDEIEQKIGQLQTQSEYIRDVGICTLLFLRRKASSISTVVEEVKVADGSYETTTLSSDDYRLVSDMQIERLADGTNPRTLWGDNVSLVYIPKDDASRRKVVTVDLVKLAVRYEGVDRESAGDWSMSMAKYDARRKELIRRLEGFGFA